MSAVEQQVIPAAEVRAAEAERVSLLATFAQKYGLEANNMMRTLRSTIFRPNKQGQEPSNEQVAAFLIVANNHNLNPFTKEIHGFLDKWGGIVAVVGLDGWVKKINEHPQFDGMSFEQDDEKCTCTMYRKDRGHPVVHTEYMIECKRDTDPWRTHPKRMLNWKALIQTARITFGFAGIYEPDEAERIVAAIDNEIDITPTPADEMIVLPEGTTPKKISPKKLREIIDGLIKTSENKDGPGLLKVWNELDNEQRLFVWGELRSWERRAIKEVLAVAQKADAGMQLDAWSISLARECTDDAALSAAFKTVTEAYEANKSDVPESVVLAFDECRQSMGAA
jgi:phage recombination protein Bet